MSLRDIELKLEYNTLVDNISRDFYVPLLSQAVSYDRAVGLFSSSSLVEISKGLVQLANNGGKVRLLVSPYLSESDIEAIRYGYELRDKVIKDALLRELHKPSNKFQAVHLNMLANLIADEIVDIRVVVTESAGQLGMFHTKIGVIRDSEDNVVAFSGSMNESANAFKYNYETVDVFKSWNDPERVELKIRGFDAVWSNREVNVKTIVFDDLNDEIIKKYKTKPVDYKNNKSLESVNSESQYEFFSIPKELELYDYQKNAIEKWFDKKCFGIYDMATGTGKTYTALASISKLSQALEENIAVVIVVPYQHLVEQWVEDIQAFNVNPIKAYSFPGNNWRAAFNDAVNGYNTGAINNFCIIACVATFILPDFQNILSKFKKNYCFVADEAHNLGAPNVRSLLPKKARYRLALSATIERHGDDEGTQSLYEYFGSEPCISFTLSEAIKNGFLTPYYYYPILVYLNSDELDEYKRITERIRKLCLMHKDEDDPDLKALFMKRARIVAGCHSKVDKLLEVIEPYKNESNILVYCGATKYESNVESDDVRQIEEVTKRLNQDYQMRVHKFTSEENQKERMEIKQMFVNHEIQVITAIKCLDEGVNIPAIKTAFILASSTNPKEYVQRRGRVLRKAEDKKYAEIYDFITLPRPLESVRFCDDEELALDYSLVRREFNRMIDFANTAKNPYDIDSLRFQIEQLYTGLCIEEDNHYD